MQIKSYLRIAVIWAILICLSFSVSTKRVHKLMPSREADKVGVDEQQSTYPPLDIDDLCKLAKNPKCEPIIDHYCDQACTEKLCAKHGSVRAMCRLMCEAEDLPPQCLKMGPSKVRESIYPNPYMQPYQNQQWDQQGYQGYQVYQQGQGDIP